MEKKRLKGVTIFAILYIIFVFVVSAVANELDEYNNLLQKAGLKADEGKYAEAINIFQEAIKLKPNEGEAYFLLAYAYILTKEPIKALEYFYKTMEMDKTYVNRYGVDIYSNIARTLELIGESRGFNREIVLSQIYYLGKLLEIAPPDLERGIKFRLNAALDKESSLEDLGSKEVKLPNDGISIEEKNKFKEELIKK